jgi:Ca-activated chloride channel homolog
MRAGVLALTISIAYSGAVTADDAILVLDASGSMWGQIEGKSKVEIARTVIGGLLTELPADRRLGLVAYGHRREADCSDIEQVVPVGTDRAAIRNAVNALNFKGRTPLSAAVKFAAEQLGYQMQKATVILVSDGVETCNLDPCALGRELEAKGVDFTAHVIGFGLASETESAGLQCLAEATGGKYIAARNAGDLAAALNTTVTVAPPVAPQVARVVLRATDLEGGPEIAAGLAWSVRPTSGAAVLDRADAGVIATEIPPGDYDVSVRTADGRTGTAKLEARAGAERTVTIPLELDLAAALKITPPDAAPVGSVVSVEWSGPNRPGDYVTVVPVGAGVFDYLSYQDTARGNPAKLTLPAEVGDYEIRYLLGQPRRLLAAVPFKTTTVTAALMAPPTGIAGGTVEIAWTGPNYANDWVTVVRPDAAETDYNDYLDASGSDRSLDLPVEPGSYEFRYVQAGRKILARAAVALSPATAEITAPASVAAGAAFEIGWTGPNNSGDWLTIIAPDAAATAYGSYADADRGSPAKLNAPPGAGPYEIRYVLRGKKVIARRAIVVTGP